ncbi:uncharacterized protein LOC131678994 [Topomyia yanbarensis]|uniref:uncharacterized protein LOC131678994 n=1 Tax=Topomyia yanbarensis TaxID=2498891 RepID=UPI00273C10D5|nr:uncharacterized protein LOC131678994 [Topomyia yanbarensis]
MGLNSVLLKMDGIRRRVRLASARRWSFSGPSCMLLLLYGFLVIVTLTPSSTVAGIRTKRKESSCYYNGTHFMEGSIVPTKEPCLMCKCQSKTLICALKVCPEQPIPPPRGCILVHKSGACCPYLQCSKLHLANKNNGDRKKIHFLDYYEKAAEDRLSNPNSLLRRSDDDDVEESGACIVNGTVYKSGSAMTTSSLCSYCYCINGRQKCVKPKCALPNPRCAPIFIDSACCPIRYDCTGKIPLNEITSTESPNPVRRINNRHYLRTVEQKSYRNNGCEVNGKTYPEGERITSQDPCEVCYCIRGARKCTPKKCAPAIKGCTPRVPRGECCAVRYDCKQTFARKIEDEEESFDFFSILFGPDPDAPKEESKNVTEIQVTEATPVSSTSEKSFFDFLKAGLEFIDSNSDDLLETNSSVTVNTTTSVSTELVPTTERTTEVHTVRVEIIQEPQTIYIEKPDFNFPSRTTIPPILRASTVRKSKPRVTTPVTTTSTTSSTVTTSPAVTTSSTTTASPTKSITMMTISTTSSTTTEAPTTSTARATQPSNTTIPVAIELTKGEPAFQDLESDSLLKENLTDVSNSLTDLESSEVSTSTRASEVYVSKIMVTESEMTPKTEQPIRTTTDPALTKKPTTEPPIEVIVKVDDTVNKSAVESILQSLHAKIESIAKTELPLPITPVTAKRPNDKFVGYETEKLPTTVIIGPVGITTVATTTVGAVTEAAITDRSDVVTTEEFELESTTSETDTEESSTTDSRSEDMSELVTTESSLETTTLEESEDDSESTTKEDAEMTSTVATTAVTDQDKLEFKTVNDTELAFNENVTQTVTEVPVTTTTPKPKPVTQKNATKPLITKENNLLSALLTELSNIFESTRNDSVKQNTKNRTEPRPVTRKPIPIREFHRPSSIPSILESDINMDYGEPTLPPSLPNLKIIPFLPADAVKKNEAPIPLAVPYDFYKPTPSSYPIITESYESYGILSDHDMHPGVPFKPPKYEYSYDPSLNYPALTENYDLQGKNNQYNAHIIRDKHDMINDSDYDYDTDALAKYDIHSKQELFKNELKKFIPAKYEAPQEGTYVPVYDKYGVGYPEKNVYYSNHKEKYEPVVYSAKQDISTEHALFRLEEKLPAVGSGFSPPTRTEGGFLPKDHIKDEFYYEPYATTVSPIELTTEDRSVRLPLNTTALKFRVTPANPFIDVIRTEPPPPLISLIEDKEKLFSVYHSVAKNNYSSLDDLLDNDNVDSAEYDKQIISITTDANYLSTIENSVEDHSAGNEVAAALTGYGPTNHSFTGTELETAENIHNTSEPEPSGMFSLENVLSYLFREDEQPHDNAIKNSTTAAPVYIDGVQPFRTIPSRISGVYDSSVSLLGDVKPSSDEEQHDGTVVLKVESASNGPNNLYRPSLMDLPFLPPNFHTGTGNTEVEYKNDIDRYGFDPDVEHYQVISDGPPNTIPHSETTYVVNPVDINKLKQHHSEGTAEITMKSKVYSLKDTVGILKLAGCNIYGRMYRVGRIISELSGPCLECKCTEVGVNCTPLNC